MAKGPRGEKRPADVIGAAVRVARIATGEETDDRANVASAAKGALELVNGKYRIPKGIPEAAGASGPLE